MPSRLKQCAQAWQAPVGTSTSWLLHHARALARGLLCEAALCEENGVAPRSSEEDASIVSNGRSAPPGML